MHMSKTECWADEFRAWHIERMELLYPTDTPAKRELTVKREEWMIRESIMCCRKNGKDS